ncbi:deoxyguanosinetriphosphate triphosphohydrolase [Sphingobium sp. Leaf26]|uniref:anti-phage deoxyguanosine triphosphatase n=1 Tax=Sphingobium sp. Leaf26 TaxID=1735693 RepID=UPI0006F2B979|nr:anti-phage deoxyguanosine triphosphatase [Sphingobium sp. Leaf26]KQN07151.1 deoxyguanosinetriphosphate triphosphohydrolase [Sphingobium sp. Leaf26]
MGHEASNWTARRSGRTPHSDDVRTNFEIDYARVVHSGAFRRLQGKTQILSLGDDDFYRSRLTHSMEVAQVAEGIAQHLRASALPPQVAQLVPPPPLIQTVGLSHDIGHPPFGHGGELALNYCMRKAGSFEGNAQTLRLLSRLENFSDDHGADLSRRTSLGLLKYPALQSKARNSQIQPGLAPSSTTIAVLESKSCKPAKACYDDDVGAFDWILECLSPQDREAFCAIDAREGKHGETRHKSFDCSIMDVADDIAYGVHDLEDAIALGFISRDDFCMAITEPLCEHLVAQLSKRPLSGLTGSFADLVNHLFGSASARKRAIGRLVHYFIRAVELDKVGLFDEPLLIWRAVMASPARPLLSAFQTLIVNLVINSPRVQHLEFKGQRMVIAVFEAIVSDPSRLLPPDLARVYEESANPLRVVSDYVSAFTDGALLRTYERLFSPRTGSVFDRI